jgi:gas vesicle protein
MAHHADDQNVVVVEKSGGGLLVFLAGAVLGAGLALLFAPQSGAQTRRMLGERARRLKDLAEEKLDEWQTAASDEYETARDHIAEGVRSARRVVDDKRARTRDVVDAGRAAVHSAREELERRLSEARAARARARAPEADSAGEDDA